MGQIGKALELSWKEVVANYKGHERDFLREIHSGNGLRRLAKSINLDLAYSNKVVSLGSIWIDKNPQCWFGPLVDKAWTKPSCELADLLVIVWDDLKQGSGRAILLQGKMALVPNKLERGGGSTAKEKRLLEEWPKFLLSKQSKKPTNYDPKVNCEFDLSYLFSDKSKIKHARFLQIRSPKTKKWPPDTYSWISYWPSSEEFNGYAKMISSMVAKQVDSPGEIFIRHSKKDDWNRLINLLIDSTIQATNKISGGKVQNNVDYMSYVTLSDCLLDLGIKNTTRNGNPIPPYGESSDDFNDGVGIPILFVSSHEIPESIERYNSRHFILSDDKDYF